MTGFRKISRNVDFWPKMAIFYQNGPKRPKRDFSAKIRKCHFRRIGKPQLCAKNQNNPMNGFLDLHRTDERTYGRTNERDLIGPNRSAGDQKSTKFNQEFGRYKLQCRFWAKKGQILTKKGVAGFFLDFKHRFSTRRPYD